MSNGFDISFEGIDMSPDDVQDLLKKYKKIKKYQKSNLFAIKTMDGTETLIKSMLEDLEQNPL